MGFSCGVMAVPARSSGHSFRGLVGARRATVKRRTSRRGRCAGAREPLKGFSESAPARRERRNLARTRSSRLLARGCRRAVDRCDAALRLGKTRSEGCERSAWPALRSARKGFRRQLLAGARASERLNPAVAGATARAVRAVAGSLAARATASRAPGERGRLREIGTQRRALSGRLHGRERARSATRSAQTAGRPGSAAGSAVASPACGSPWAALTRTAGGRGGTR